MEPDRSQEAATERPPTVPEESNGKRRGWLKIVAGAVVPIIIAGLFILHNAGIIDLAQYGGFMHALNPTPGVSGQPGNGEDPIQVFFTTPQYPDTEKAHHGGLDEKLVAGINEAQTNIDIAAYEFDLDSVAQALLAAKERGVRVRFVTDSDNADERAVLQLKRAGIPIVEDNREPIMHNKFVILDNQVVWTGSWNLTENGTYRNNNNVVRIASELIAENYTTEFEEMFMDGGFGPTSADDTPHRHVKVPQPGSDDTIHIETYFAPEDQVMGRLRKMIKGAEKSVRFMAFSFTHDKLGEEMKKQDKAGLTVQGVFEERGADTEFSEYGMMTRARPKLDVLLDGNPYIMHHKVIILDDETVVLGSYNFSENAEEMNDENLIVIHDKEVAGEFRSEFERIYQQAEDTTD